MALTGGRGSGEKAWGRVNLNLMLKSLAQPVTRMTCVIRLDEHFTLCTLIINQVSIDPHISRSPFYT